MSTVSEFGKRIGIREWNLARDGKRQANKLFQGYMQQVAEALEDVGRQLGDQAISHDAVLRMAHQAIERLGVPFYILAIAGPLIDTLIIRAEDSAGDGLAKVAKRIRGARL